MSNIAQLQLRYHTAETLSDLSNLSHAFPGDMCLVLENHVMYQCVEYTEGTAPTPDGHEVIDVIIVSEDESESESESIIIYDYRWVAIDTYYTKAISGTFTQSSWSPSNECFMITIPVVNPVTNLTCTIFDANNRVVIPQDVFIRKTSDAITAVQVTVGMYPDCRFAGSYYIQKDKIA